MDLPDCPPGAEGYQDSVTEVPRKLEPEDFSTKAEAEFLDHLNSLKIRLEDGETRCMVERRGRDISGMWIYLCYPCAAVCSGESILQTHISGKKHKIKLAMRNVWPKSIFDDHPFNQTSANKSQTTEKVLQKMAEEVDNHNKSISDLDEKYNKYRTVTCHIQDSLDTVKAPLIGVEYLVEHPPEQAHYEPTYMCTLCSKQGHPRTIINHMTCFWHRFNYLVRHYPEACALLKPYRTQPQYREGVGVIMNRLSQRIEDKYGRKRPVNIDKDEYEKDKIQIHEWIFRGHHFSEKDGATFIEVVDTGLIDSLHKSNDKKGAGKDKREPSPPIVAAPSRPLFNNFSDADVVEQVDLTASPGAQEGGSTAPEGGSTAPEDGVPVLRAVTKARGKRSRNGRRSRQPHSVRRLRKQARQMNPFAVILKQRAAVAPPIAPPVEATTKIKTPPPPVIVESFPEDDPLYGCLASPAVTDQPINRRISAELSPPRPTGDEPRWIPLHPIYSKSFADRPAGRQERRAGSVESLSDISDDADHEHRRDAAADKRAARDKHYSLSNKARYEPYDKQRRAASPARSRHAQPRLTSSKSQERQQRPPNYEYKVKLAEEKLQAAEESLKKTLAYHEKNPEKHPLYPEEWKKFWNRRYKEIQAEGKDPSKHDFKPEWIVFWTARMKELHQEELRIEVNEVYRRLCLSPPDLSKRSSEPQQSVDKSRVSEPRRKSPEVRRKSPPPRRRSPEPRRRPERYERSDHRLLREPLPPRRRSPLDFRRDRRSPPPHVRRSPGRRRSPEHRRSPPPPHHKRTRSRSPLHRRSPARTNFALESIRRSSRSPLSQREQQRNRSPEHSTRQVAPSLQTVLISDDELKPDDGLSPWNSDNEIESVGSAPDTRTDRSRADSIVSRGSKVRRRRSMSGGHSTGGHGSCGGPAVDSAADDVVATLRTLVALEDYLGSLGPKIVDLLADALKMEKEKANSSEELLESEMAVVLIETAKEKLKGAVQAGLVGGSAAQALRAAVVRAAATLHEADKRTRLKKQNAAPSKPTAVPVAVAGVGEVDRAQIAQQMAEALIAQGKTDVSSEDLAVLVDAVVGMAEAKKRAAEQTKKVVLPTPVVAEKPVIKTPFLAPKPSGTASALQMLQSAYDENDKKMEQSNTDAMDGLSDSDLETLLKNFNELSAEEQHSLIAYLKKLEAKEPERVERLRQYVSEAASTAPKERSPEPAEPEEVSVTKTVIVESDDDDYTVEEVFQSATQKVKENQIRQEMEVVKKSLEETKVEPTSVEPAKLENSLAAITKSLSASSATDLFALVQASIKAAPAASPAPLSRSPSVVVSNTQPRSFGDLPEQGVAQELLKPPQSAPVSQSPFSNQGPGSEPAPFSNLQGLLRTPARFQPPQQQQQQPRPQQQQQRPQQQQQQQPQHQQQQQQHPQQQQQQRPQQQQQHHPQQQQQHPQQQQQHPQQQQQHSSQQQNYQSPPLNQQNYQSSQQNQADYQSPPPPQQQNYQPAQQNQQQPHYNRQQGQQQGYQPAPQHQQHSQGPQHNQILPLHQQRTQPPQHQQQQQQYQPPHQPQYQPPQHQQQNYNDNRNKPNDSFNQGQWNPRPNMMDNRGPLIRGPAPDNFGPNAPYNQGPRNNFMNGRGQDNYDTRPQMNQQFGNNNYDNNQNNFRGRGGGRGNFGAPARGRGRGYY